MYPLIMYHGDCALAHSIHICPHIHDHSLLFSRQPTQASMHMEGGSSVSHLRSALATLPRASTIPRSVRVVLVAVHVSRTDCRARWATDGLISVGTCEGNRPQGGSLAAQAQATAVGCESGVSSRSGPYRGTPRSYSSGGAPPSTRCRECHIGITS